MGKVEAIRRLIAKQEETRFSGISEGQIKILCDIATVMDLQGVYKKHNHSIAYVAGYTNVKAVKQALAGLERRGLIIRLYNQPNPKCVIRCLYFTEPFAEMIKEEVIGNDAAGRISTNDN